MTKIKSIFGLVLISLGLANAQETVLPNPESTTSSSTVSNAWSYNSELSAGLTPYFNPGSIVFADGTAVNFGGGSIVCIASRTNYIGISMHDLSLRAWRQGYDDGTIWIAKVITGSSSITSVEQYSTPRVPPGRIERTKAKLAAGLPVKVYVCGSSLVYGSVGSPTNRWLKLLWDGSATVTNYLVTGYATTIVEDRSANSQAMRGNWSFLWRQITAQQLVKYPDNAWLPGQNYTTRYYQSSSIREAPSNEGGDLAIVCGSFNSSPDGTYGDKYAFYESTVRELRRRGFEVICSPDHSSSSSPNSRWDEYYQIKNIAEAYGCAFADTASAMDYARASGASVYYDTVHQNDAGHAQWASAMRGVLNDYKLTVDNSRAEIPLRRVVPFLENTQWNTNAPGMVDMQFRFIAGSGAYQATTQADTNNPSVWIGGNSQTNSRITFNSGGIFTEFAHPRAMAMDLILDAIQDFTLEIYTSNRTSLIKTIAVETEGSTPKVIPCLTASDILSIGSYTGLESAASPWRNVTIQLKCVVGATTYTNAARILGVAWHVPRVEEKDFSDIALIGTWTTSSASIIPLVVQSNTDTDGFSFCFSGPGAIITLGTDNSTGIVDVWLDGRSFISGLDLYNNSASGGLYSLNILPGASPYALYNGVSRKHYAKVTLNGRNASGSGNPRIRIVEAMEVLP